MQSAQLLHSKTMDGKKRPLLCPVEWIKLFFVMILLLVIGVLAALCQHAFYSHLDGQQPERYFIPQIWVIRIGITLAFLFKMSLVAAVGNAYVQQSWYSFQRNAMTVDGIDAVFGILQDPRKFLVMDMVLRTRILALMAFVSWLIPLSAIFSTASLTGIFNIFDSDYSHPEATYVKH